MDTDEATQATQGTQGLMDPRRIGRNNSGISEADISDVICILHPCSPAAFRIVASTAEVSPQNVLQNNGFGEYDDGLTQSALEEQETFILSSDGPNQAMDLALRFTANVINPTLGFVFGRNGKVCDIVLATDIFKRVSNMHFCIFMNESGVLMLRDISTNGTMVDDIVLRGGKTSREPQTRMLNSGSIIQILSPKPDEIVKFIVRIPSREGHIEEYEAKFQIYMRRVAIAGAAMAKEAEVAKRITHAEPSAQAASYKAPLVHNQYGMHWGGGEKYNVVGLIGKGAFATVYQLATKSEGLLFAAKELEKRKFMKNGVLDRKLSNEMEIMKAISHPNIVRYVDYQDVANNLYIIMEFVPCGDLQQYLAYRGPMIEGLGKKMAFQVLDSLAYLHAMKITHRDIKPDNILIANLDPDYFTVKLSDFGLSKVVKDNDTFLKTFCGTLLYCAPEVFPHYDAHVAGRGQKRPRKGTVQQPSKFHSYSQSVDIWSFGAVLWYSLCVKPPFEGVADNTGRGMFEKIMMTPLDPADLQKQGVSDDAVALLAEMLNTDPASRPPPSYCLRHKWFGTAQPVTAGAASPELGLRVIAEEDDEEAEAGGGPAFSQLSLNERVSHFSEDSLYDEASIHSGSMDFFDPRQSKRFKSEAFAYRQHEQGEESSSELLHQSIHIVHQPQYGSPPNPSPAQRKLFGEISQSVSGGGALGMQANVAPGNSPNLSPENDSRGSTRRSRQAAQAAGGGEIASPSLLGAESLMREVHMDSPYGTDSPAAESNEPTTPQTPGDSHANAGRSNGTPTVQNDITPKPVQQPKFDRQIKIKWPATFYDNPANDATHRPQSASSKMNGHDFVASSSHVVTAETSLPGTTRGSATADDRDDHYEDTDAEHEVPAPLSPPLDFIKPASPLGRLVATSDSFAQVTLDLNDKITTWGRDTSNTYVYPDKNDTRVPKRGIIVYYHAKGIDKVSEACDWTKLSGLHCGIATQSSAGIYVNGVELRRGEPDRMNCGRVYTGDEVLVARPGSHGQPGLKFRCEFFHGEGKHTRPEGSTFQVEIANAED